MELVEKREFSDKKREELADKGHALPDGSFPIENTTDLHNAIQSIGRAKDYDKVKRHIVSRARDLGAIKMLPEEWGIKKSINDEDLTKAETFKPTESMAANARRAIKLKEDGKANGAGTAVGWTRARQLANMESLTLDTVKRMYSFFSRHEVDKKGKDWDNSESPSHGKIMWLAWGGDSGFAWSRAIVNRLKKDITINLIEDLSEMTKAIGTTSSANQEADERSVENYVRQSANVNTRLDYNTGTSLDNIGGSIVSNTTEPDPKGDIAVQKDLPNATRPDAPAIVDQETRPEGDVSPSAAEHNTPDVSTNGAGVYKAGMTCPDCGQAVAHKCAVDKADEANEDDKVEKAAAGDEVTEDSDEDDNVKKSEASQVTEQPVKKSIWGGAFVPFSDK